jgi:hypothetical protein
MPESLLTIHDGLSEIAERAIGLEFKFFWEREEKSHQQTTSRGIQTDLETVQ